MNNRVAIAVALCAMLGLGASKVPAPRKFVAIDRCLNSNGAWDYRKGRCQPVPAGPIDFLIIDKSDRWLAAYRGGKLIREFRVALGRGGLRPKQRQGDGRVPEGSYLITFHNAASSYHLSLKIGYPTDEQRAAAQLTGINLGGDIMIHGLPNRRGRIGSRHTLRDWTEGCIAVANQEIEWLFDAVPDATPVTIRA